MVEKLRELIIEMLQKCEDEDLLDLVHKLLLTESS
jgi:hypothetical protein